MTGTTVVHQHEVSDHIRSLSTMTSPDYVDVFAASTNDTPGSPEEWARALVEDAAGVGGQVGWRVVLGLRLRSGSSPSHVGGWEIAGRGENWIRHEATSRFLTAHVVVHVDDEQVTAATFVRYDRPIAAKVWAPVSLIHRGAMPRLLRHAVRIRGKARDR